MEDQDQLVEAYTDQALTVQDDLYRLATNDPAVDRIARMLARGGWRAKLAKLTPTYVAEF